MGGGYESWYWYVTGCPHPDVKDLPNRAGQSVWHTEDWTGAVLTGEAILALDQASRRNAVR